MSWRENLRPASFRGARFFVDVAGQQGGRRQVGYEFPKRDKPYAEDMGRRGRRFSVQAYVIGPDYTDARDVLIAAMEQEGPGLLVRPTFGEILASPETYSVQESRVRGNIAEFDMVFIEPGNAMDFAPSADTQAVVRTLAGAASGAAATAIDRTLAAGGTVDI